MVAKSGFHPSESSAAHPATDIDTLLRSVLFVAVFLMAWISFHPFVSLAEPPQYLTTGGDLLNQVGFTSVFLALAAWTLGHEPGRLVLLVRPALVLALMCCVLSVVTSWEPALAARRLAFALVLLGIAAMTLLLPKNVRHFKDLLATSVLIVLVVCYLGVLLVPQLAVHQATDFVEPEHAGNWRGVFAHKNQAGATMVLFIFVGMFVARMGSAALGSLIVVLATIFLAFTQSKTAIGVLPLVFVLGWIITHSRKPIIGVTIVLLVLAVFELASVGTVLFEPVRKLVGSIMPDATFTGRTEIWQIAIDAVAQRPITGYGFSAFWGTPEVIYGLGDNSTWVNAATDAHNAYLNLAVTIGLPGMLLTIVWFVVLPIVDYYRRLHRAEAGPLQTLFLRVCLFGTFESCFESSMFQQVGEVWFFFMVSAFGLRLLSVTRATA
jgi:O-antigen ligase